MKIFTNKSIWKKIAIALVIIILFEFMLSSPVRADDDGVGGKLMQPVMSLVTSLGDGIVGIIHESVMGQSQSMIRVNMSTNLWEKIGGWVVGIIVGLAVIVAVLATGGLAVLALGAIGITASVSIGVGTILTGVVSGYLVGTWYDNTCLPQDLVLPIYSISAEEIFKGDILLFDVDFFNPRSDIYAKTKNGNSYKVKDYTDQELNEKISNDDDEIQNYYYVDENGKEIVTSKQNTAFEIQTTISKWYNALRNIALVLMMSVLLYVAIRMMLSSMAADKAKYKQMLTDWLVGMCLLFFLHYIMAFSVTLVKQFTKVIDSGFNEKENLYAVLMEDDEAEKLSKKIKDLNMEESITDNDDGKSFITWPTNLMGKVRLQAQLTMGTTQFIGYSICFIILVMYTLFFAVTYLKRVIYLAFLTMIAPFVALTYPIDKLNDGQAQGFNKWLKEYIFNLLIQPMHLLLYTILVSSVFEFAGINIIYMLVSIGFLLPAEKLLRSLFGFEKASTPGSLAGAAIGASMISKGIGQILHKGSGGADKKRLGKGSTGGDDDGDLPINYNDNSFDEIGAMGGTPDNARGTDNEPNDTPPPPPPMGGPGNPPPPRPTGGTTGGRSDNNDDIIDLNDDEWEIRDSDTPSQSSAVYGLPMYSNGSNNTSNSDDDDLEYPLRYADVDEPESSPPPQTPPPQTPPPQTPPPQTPPPQTPNRQKTTRGQRLKRAAKVGGRRLVSQAGRGIVRGVANGVLNAPNTTARLLTGALVGGVAGTFGVAAGIASGDIKNVATYGGAAIGAGAMAGSGMVNSAKNRFDGALSGTAQAMKQAYYEEDEYRQKQVEKQNKQWKKDLKNREYLERAVGMDKAKEMYKNGDIDEYLKYGIKDAKEMATIQKLQDEGIARDRQHAMAIHDYAERTGDTTKMKKKDRDEWKSTYENEFKDRGHTEDRAKTLSEDTLKYVDQYNKLKKKL